MWRKDTLHSAFTLVELLIVIAIMGLIIQLVLPAIQQSRESARRVACTNSMRQIGVAIHAYEGSHRKLPPGYKVEPSRHGFIPYLLPYLEQEAIFDRYRFDLNWDDVANDLAVRRNLGVVQCASTPRTHDFVTDYGVYTQISPRLLSTLYREQVIVQRDTTHGALRERERRVASITDGLSHTVFVCEVAGRPDRYKSGLLKSTNSVSGSEWANPQGCFRLGVRCGKGDAKSGGRLFNCTNDNEIYSFHPHVANFLFGDGSVHTVEEGISLNAFVSMLTAAAGD